MYIIFFFINLFINVCLNNILDFIVLVINKISQNLQLIDNYLMTQKNNLDSLQQLNNVISLKLYETILNNYEFNQLVNKTNYLNNMGWIIVEYFNMCCNFVEEVIILNQKFYYEHINNLFNSVHLYRNLKILLNKNLINNNNLNELMYNITFDLILDNVSLNYKGNSIFYYWKDEICISENYFRGVERNKQLWLSYCKWLKKTPIDVSLKLFKATQQNSRLISILNYGLDYDVSIFKNKNYFLSETQSLKSKNIDINNFKINDVNLFQKNYYKGYEVVKYNNQEEELSKINFLETNIKYNDVLIYKYENSFDLFKYKSNLLFNRDKKTMDFVSFNKRQLFGGYSYWWYWHKDMTYTKRYELKYKNRIMKELEFMWNTAKWQLDNFDIRKYYFDPQNPLRKLKIPPKVHKSYIGLHSVYAGKIYQYFKDIDVEVMTMDVVVRKKYLKYLLHGVKGFELEKKFFKTFLKSDDIWLIYDYGFANSTDKFLIYYNTLYQDYIINDKKYSKAFGVDERIEFLNFRINRPKITNKKSLKKYSIAFLHTYLDEPNIKNWFKNYKGLYKQFLKKICIYMEYSNHMHLKSHAAPKNFLQKLYVVNLWVRKDYLKFANIINQNNITWNEFYSNIEDVSQEYNLNYIQKEFYGRHYTNNLEKFLLKKSKLMSETELPKNLNVLIKKTYIENLMDAYKVEEEPMKNYIYYRLRLAFFIDDLKLYGNIIYNIMCNIIWVHGEGLKMMHEYIMIKVNKIIELKELRHFITFFTMLKSNYEYIWILVIGCIYSLICSLLILLIKSILPKNLVYGVKKSDKIKFLENLNKLWSVDKPYFNFEYKYIYKWNEKNEKKWEKQKILLNNKYKAKVNENIVENYSIFYKKFLFETNLSKWENNTKIRFNYKLWLKHITIYIWAFFKVFQVFFKDRKYNHNRKIIWKDPNLDSHSKVKYYHEIPRYFANISFIFHFVISVFQIWEYRYFVMKWTQLVKYGVTSGLNYKALEKELEKNLSLEWYKDNLDFGVGLLYTNFLEIKNKLNKITKEHSIKKKETDRIIKENQNTSDIEELLKDIITLSIEERKLKKITKFQEKIKELKNERFDKMHFELKFENIKEKLKSEIIVISEKEKMKQTIMHKYRYLVQKQKLTMLEEELQVIKQSYTRRIAHSHEDTKKRLTVLEPEYLEKVRDLKKNKIWLIEYERITREKNYENEIIDKVLDKKELTMFESIKEYNEELSEAIAELDRKERMILQEKSNYEQTSKLLFNNLEQSYISYRFYTTMGARFYYILSMIFSLFTIWNEHITKIRKNDYSLITLILIIKTDLLKYIYKIYWEYILIWKKYETFKQLGNQFKEIFKFSLLILTPITIIAFFLYISLGVYYILIKILIKQINLNLTNKFKKIKNIIFLKRIWNKLIKFKKYVTILKILFINVETGESLGLFLYKKFYNICGIIQRTLYYIKGAFILGYKTGGVFLGIKNILKWVSLKYKAYLEKKYILKKNKKKKNWKNVIIEQKKDMALKINMILILWDLERSLLTIYLKIIKLIYRFIVYPLFKIDYLTYINSHKKPIIWWMNKYTNLSYKFGLLKGLINQLTVVDFFKLLINFIWEVITLPIKFINNYYNYLVLDNYKQGVIINFWSILKFLKIKKNKELKKSLKLKIHEILLNKKISIYLKNQKITESSILEIFLIFKYKEKRLDKHKEHYIFWKEIYWVFKEIKIEFFDFFINHIDVIEETYASFEVSLETKNWSYYKRIKYGYFAAKLKNQLESKKFKNNEKKYSRNFFFRKKTKEREKVIRKYLIKGILNWISYITTGKVIFKKIKELKKQKIKIKKKNYKYINYNLNNLSEKYHIGKYLDDVPPQLWALVIIYELYYKYFFRYVFGHGDAEVPKPWTTDLKNSRDRKWRISSPVNRRRIPYRNTAFITVDVTANDLNELYVNLKKKPYDPILRWVYFVLESQAMYEVLAKKGNEVWGDISLTHLLTYNNKLDSYNYEIREFFRILEGNSFLRRAENQLAIDKMKDYKKKYELLWENIHNQNKKIAAEILEERRDHAVKLLYKSLLYYKELNANDQDLINDDEKSQDMFYAMKVNIFEEHDVVEFLEWKSTFDSKIPEFKYFNRQDIDSLKYWQRSEYEKLNIEGLAIELDVLANHIVLLSFDQTWEEIRCFLKIDILKKIENKNNIINYQNLNIINPSIIKNIYWDSYIEIEPRKEYGKHFYGTTKVKDAEDELFSYIKLDFDIMKWKTLKYDVFYGFQQNHIINRFYESGKVYIYNEKDKYDTSIITLDIEESFHGNYLFSEWVSKILKRYVNLKNIKRNSSKRKKIKEDNNSDSGVIAYVNNIRWTWEQWLGYGNIEQEEYLLKKNLLILYDRCNIWFLKRAPIRLKLPVKLALTRKDIKHFIKSYTDEKGFLENNYFLLAHSMSGMIKSSLEFLVWRREIELKYNKNIGDIIFWIITEYSDQEVKNLTKEHAYILDNFLQNFMIFNKLYYVGLPAYTWDLIRYHDLFSDLDEFEYTGYLELKQKEYLMHDVELRKYAHKLINIAITKYNPGSYVYIYDQKKIKYFYWIFNISAKVSLLMFLDVLFYHPGQYIANIHILFCPFMFYIIFLYLKGYMKKLIEIKEGRDLNLYRYQDYEDESYIDKILSKEEKMNKVINKYNFLNNTDWTPVDFERRFKDKRSEWEKLESITRGKRNLREKNNFYYNFSSLEKLSQLWYILIICVLTEMWGTQKFRFRNNKFFWEFYLPEEIPLFTYMPEFEFMEQSYSTRTWEYDCYWRLEGGGNVYSRWYENKYREFQEKELLELDPGYYDSQIIKNQDLYMWYNDYTVVHINAGLVDAYWNHFARRSGKDIPEYLDISKYDYMLLDTAESKARRTRKNNLPNKFDLKEFAFQPERADFYASIFEIWGVNIRNSITDVLRYLILGPDQGKLYNPVVRWLEFKQNMLDEYGYDIKHTVITVMFKAKAATADLILTDVNRYWDSKLNTMIEEHKRKQRLIYLQNNSFEKELPLELKVLYLMPENEKHLNLLYSNFLKYKLKRLDYYINSVNLKKKDLKNITNHKLEVELYFNKHEKYLTSIFRKISYEDRVEYKANLWINFFKEEKWTWSYLKDFIYNYPLSNSISIWESISEYSDILLKIISSL